MALAGHTIIQANVNHSARAQDLLKQTMVEWNIGLATILELYRVRENSNWAGNWER